MTHAVRLGIFALVAILLIAGPAGARRDDKCHKFFENPGDKQSVFKINGVESDGQGHAVAPDLHEAVSQAREGRNIETIHETPDGSVQVKTAFGDGGNTASISESNRNHKAFQLSILPVDPEECCHEVQAQKTVLMRAAGLVYLREAALTSDEDYKLEFGTDKLFRSRIVYMTDRCEQPDLTIELEKIIKLTVDWESEPHPEREGEFRFEATTTGTIQQRVLITGEPPFDVTTPVTTSSIGDKYEFEEVNLLPPRQDTFFRVTEIKIDTNDVHARLTIEKTKPEAQARVGVLSACSVTSETFKDKGRIE